jgi:hypothetical protein
MDKSELVALLKSNVVEVTFNKVDGEQRVMSSTLMESYLPPRDPNAGESTKKDNPDVISVWDTNKSGWRSFRVKNVTNTKIL